MADLTVHAEHLVSLVARAFYQDETVAIIDVLLRDKYLREDDMSKRLSLPGKMLRKFMEYLRDEGLVKVEEVDDLDTGGSQRTKFWYIDYNHAVKVIRLRVHLMMSKLEKAERMARGSSMYLCPGYATRACNGRYTEEEAQRVTDHQFGMFLCIECYNNHVNNPDPPPISQYTLKLVDNSKELKAAVANIKKVKEQLSSKTIGNFQLRYGIFDLLQLLRKTREPLSSNLPSENRDNGIGSKRIEGTGRTAFIKKKKQLKQGGHSMSDFGRSDDRADLTFLKNARGEEIAFEVEKNGGALAVKAINAVTIDEYGYDTTLIEASQKIALSFDPLAPARDRKRAKLEKKKKNNIMPSIPPFLRDNIGRGADSFSYLKGMKKDDISDDDPDDEDMEGNNLFGFQQQQRSEVEWQIAFQEQLNRQKSLFFEVPRGCNGDRRRVPTEKTRNNSEGPDNVGVAESDVIWQDCLTNTQP